MSFIQVIEMRTKKFDDLQALGDQFFEATEGKRTVRRSVLTRDRNDPERYLLVVFFDSFESAMENSNLPATAEFAQQRYPSSTARRRSTTSRSSRTGPEGLRWPTVMTSSWSVPAVAARRRRCCWPVGVTGS